MPSYRTLTLSLFAVLFGSIVLPATAEESTGWEITINAIGPSDPTPPPIQPAEPAEAEGEEGEEGEGETTKEVAAPEPATIRFHGHVLELGAESTRLRAIGIGEKELVVPTANIVSLRKPDWIGQPGNKANSGAGEAEVGFRVELKGGGEFTGVLASFDDKGARLESPVFGDLAIPLAAVSSIIRLGNDEISKRDDSFKIGEGEARAQLDTGEVLLGKLSSGDEDDAGWVSLTGKNVSAKFPVYLVNRLDFPLSEEKEEQGNKGLSYEVGLLNGTRFICRTVKPGTPKFSLTTMSGISFQCPESGIESIYPVSGTGGISGQGLLVWGGYSDADQEYLRTKSAAEKSKLRMDEVKEKIPGRDFRSRLMRSRVFLVPKMETLNTRAYDTMVDYGGEKMKLRDYLKNEMGPALQEYLRRGGHVVFTGLYGNQLEFLRLVEIDNVRVVGARGLDYAVSKEAKRVFQLDEDRMTLQRNTYAYIPNDDWQLMLGEKTSAAMISRKFKRGRVTIMGSDFYRSSEVQDGLLHKVLEAR